MCPSAPRVCSETGGQKPVLSLLLDLIDWCQQHNNGINVHKPRHLSIFNLSQWRVPLGHQDINRYDTDKIDIAVLFSHGAKFSVMMTSSNGNIFALLAICAGNSPVHGEFPAQRPVTRSFDVILICAWTNGWVNNRVSGDLWCHRTHYDVNVMYVTVSKRSIDDLQSINT